MRIKYKLSFFKNYVIEALNIHALNKRLKCSKFHVYNFLNKSLYILKYLELVKSTNAIVLRIKFSILIIPHITFLSPIQNGKLAFKSLKCFILGVHLIEN